MTESNQTPERPVTGSQERPVKKRKRRRKRNIVLAIFLTILKVLGTLLLIGVITGLLVVLLATTYIKTSVIPEAREWAENLSMGGGDTVSLTSTMYYTDANGVSQPYLTLDSAENRVWIRYKDLEKTDLVNALIAIEDKRFITHEGVDWLRTGRGVLNMFTGGSIQGGSTITQQLIKNITGENEVTVNRKILEIFRALEFEKTHSKEQILEWYLNEIYLGERSYGVGAASWAYFGKDVQELSLAQCASLVGITNNPSRYDPYLNKNAEVTNDMANRKRAKLVLWNMLDQEMIDEAAYNAACAEVDRMVFVMGSPEGGEVTTVYNWYQDQVITDVVNDLMETYKWSQQTAINQVYYGGLSIYTNVDLRVQGILEEIYADTENLPYVSKSGQPMQSGMVIVDNQGRVVALAGGMGEKNKNRVWSRASSSKRPSGSSIKPLSVYAPALEMGLITPNSIVDDAPYMEVGEKPWPSNAVGFYKGLDTVRHAVEQSANTVAVRVLGDYVTLSGSYQFLEERFHISSLVWEKWINDKKFTDMDYSPLALGGLTTGVSVYEMAAAYAAFPSMGRYVPPRTYSVVKDSAGRVLLDRTGDGEYILKESTAYYMNSMLQGVVTQGTGREAAIPGMTVAGKTGTTTSQKDLWFVGYTPYYTGAVWTGYDRQERIGNVGHPQTVLWQKVMARVHEGLEDKEFPAPSGLELVTASYCLDSGMKPTAECALDVRGSRVATGTYVQGDAPTQFCTLHTPIQVCTDCPILNEETGEATGRFRLAGENCPEASVKTVSVLDFEREGAAAKATVRDSGALLGSYDPLDVCTVHTEGTAGGGGHFDPHDPATWPTDDPDFDINDPATWPAIDPGVEPGATIPEPPGGETPEPPAWEPPTNPEAPETPPDDPFVPADGAP